MLLQEEANCELPRIGCIAGQSVAEAYFRIKNIDIVTRIKDVDLFIDYKKVTKSEKREYSQFLKPYFSSLNINHHLIQNKKKTKVPNESFSEEVVFVEEKNIHYSIKKVFDVEKINIIEVVFAEHASRASLAFLKATIANFDLNCVEIGVCLKTRRLYMSKAFESFISHRQVLLTSHKRCMKSLVRFLQKKEYFKGAYFNFSYEANLCLPFFKLNEEHVGKSILLQSYNKLSSKSKIEFEKFFHVSSSSFEIFKYMKIKFYSGKESDIYNYRNRLEKREQLYRFYNKVVEDNANVRIISNKVDYLNPGSTTSIRKFMEESTESVLIKAIVKYTDEKADNITTPVMRKWMVNSRDEYMKNELLFLSSNVINIVKFKPKVRKFDRAIKSSLKLIGKSKKNKKLFSEISKNNRDVLKLFFNKNKANYFIENMKTYKNKYKELVSMCNEFDINILKILYIEKRIIRVLLRHIEVVRKGILESIFYLKNEFCFIEFGELLLKFEKSENSFLIGEVESNSISIGWLRASDEELSEYIKKSREMDSIKALVLNKDVVGFPGYKINQIVDGIGLKQNGYEMRHCVGGYGERLRNRSMLFFNIYDRNNDRFTMSVSILKKETPFHIDQIKGRFNKSCPVKVEKDMKEFVRGIERNLTYSP